MDEEQQQSETSSSLSTISEDSEHSIDSSTQDEEPHYRLPQRCKRTPRQPFLKRRSIRGTFSKLFRLTPRVQSQHQSRFLSLPLEVRQGIYTYVFASCLVYEQENEPLSTWDNLMLTCRKAKVEMESLPIQPIILLIKNNWDDSFPNDPLHISSSTKDGRVEDLTIAIPRIVLTEPYEYEMETYIPKYLSPLFRIFADSLTLTIVDDGSPHPHPDLSPLFKLYGQIEGLIWARDPALTRLGRKVCRYPVSEPPCRNYFNSKRVTVDWEGHIGNYGGQVNRSLNVVCMNLEWNIGALWRHRIGLGSRKFKVQPLGKGRVVINGVTWESSRRFRR